jgi:hypothetical protein
MNYKDIHDKIIDKARKENRLKGDGNYYEAHHIKPKCMGGEGTVQQWRTHPNIILLTAKEHFVIHKLLCEIYPDNYDLAYAYWGFVNGRNKSNHKGNVYYNIGSREYERLRIIHCYIENKSGSTVNIKAYKNDVQIKSVNIDSNEYITYNKVDGFTKGTKITIIETLDD